MRLSSHRWIFGFAVMAILGLWTLGCASRGNVELLEARLRDQEDELRSLQTQVDRTNAELVAARRLNDTLKQQIVRPASHDQTFDLSELQFRVTGLKINSLLTGGFDRDKEPGDDQVTLFFAPIDDRGQAVQVPGQVECELIDPSLAGEMQRLGLWKFDIVTTQAAWQKTLGSVGYRFELPWQKQPQSRDLEIRVRYQAGNGDRFEAASPVRISLSPAALAVDSAMP